MAFPYYGDIRADAERWGRPCPGCGVAFMHLHEDACPVMASNLAKLPDAAKEKGPRTEESEGLD